MKEIVDKIRLSKTSLADEFASHLNRLIIESSDLVRARQKCLENLDEFKFKPGQVVKHKLYNFRGVVQSRDARPRFNVSNWDGLKEIESLEQPFYVVIPDEDDCKREFGSVRQWRYVIQENLEELSEDDESGVDLNVNEAWLKHLNMTFDKAANTWSVGVETELRCCMNDEEHSKTLQYVQRLNDLLQGILHDIKFSNSKKSGGGAGGISLHTLYDLMRNAESDRKSEHFQQLIIETLRSHNDENWRRVFHDLVDKFARGEEADTATMTQLDDFISKQPDFAEAWNWKAVLMSQNAQRGIADANSFHTAASSNDETLLAAMKVVDDEVLSRVPFHWRALIGKAEILAKLKRWDEAKDVLDETLRVNPWASTSRSFHYIYRVYERMIEEDNTWKEDGENTHFLKEEGGHIPGGDGGGAGRVT